MPPLFDSRPRDDNSYSRHDETWFDFLDRVDDVVFGRIRVALNEWFAELPWDKAQRLRAEFRSGRDVQVEAAFLEMFLHAAFQRTPLSVEIEPGRSAGKQPDFRCWPRENSADDFYVEARLVGNPAAVRAREKRLKNAFDDLNRAEAPRFSIMVAIEQEGHATPAGAELRRRILPWLESLDYEHERSKLEAGESDLPHRTFGVTDWIFNIRAIPIPRTPPNTRPHRLVAVEPVRTAAGGSTREFANAVRTKGSRYSLPDRPYCIALGNTHTFQSGDDAADVLVGQEVIEFPRDRPEAARLTRRADGYFRPDRNRRVSAVLHVQLLTPWGVFQAQPDLWINPYARQRFPVSLPWANTLTLSGREIFRVSAQQTLRVLFGLSSEWPGPEKPFALVGS